MNSTLDKTHSVILQNIIDKNDLERYLDWRNQLNQELETYQGFLGLEIISAKNDTISNDALKYHIIFRFDNYDNLEKWQNSEYLKSKLIEASSFLDSDFNINIIEGMEQWYDLPKDRSVMTKPPYLKQVLLVICTVYPLIIGSAWVLRLVFPMDKLYPNVAIFFNVIIVAALMTYPVMPIATKLLRPWLYKKTVLKNL